MRVTAGASECTCVVCIKISRITQTGHNLLSCVQHVPWPEPNFRKWLFYPLEDSSSPEMHSPFLIFIPRIKSRKCKPYFVLFYFYSLCKTLGGRGRFFLVPFEELLHLDVTSVLRSYIGQECFFGFCLGCCIVHNLHDTRRHCSYL